VSLAVLITAGPNDLVILFSNLAAGVADNGVIHAGTAWGRYKAGASLNIVVVHHALARFGLRVIVIRRLYAVARVAVLVADLVGLVIVRIGCDSVSV